MALQIKRPSTAFSKDKPRRATGGRKRVNLDDHRRWIKSLPSLINGSMVDVDPCHINQADATVGKRSRGKSQKADDYYIVPLTRTLHDELDRELGYEAFEKKYQIDLVKVAQALYICSQQPDRDETAEIIVSESIEAAKNANPENS